MSGRRGRTTPGTNAGSFAPGTRAETHVALELDAPASTDPYAPPGGVNRQSSGLGPGRTGGTLRQIDEQVRGWEWVASEFRRVREEARAEATRLLGPDRGE